MSRYVEFAIHDFSDYERQFARNRVGASEGELATEHDIEDDSAGPDVRLGTAVLLAQSDFWRGIVRTAARCLQPFVVLPRCHAEVNKLDVSDRIKKNIFGLDVAMTDLELVTITDCTDYLAEDSHGFDFFELSVLNDVVEQLATFDVLQNQVAAEG